MSVVSALVIASTAISAASSVASARGQRRAANDTVNEGNRLAADAIDRGEEDAARYGIQLDQVLGRQRAVFAASGLDAEVGSAKQVATESAAFGAQDVAQIRENAMREAYGLKRQAQGQARALRASATGSYGQAFGTLLAGGARGWELYQAGRTNIVNNAMSSAFRSSPALYG